MAVFYTEVSFAGRTAKCLEIKYEAERAVDATGRPASIVRGGLVHITVESTDSTAFFEAAADSYTPNSGTVTFYKPDTNAVAKTLTLTNAYIIEYEEEFDHQEEIPTKETIVISAEKITMGGGTIDNLWAKA